MIHNHNIVDTEKLAYCYGCEWEVKGKVPDAHSESETRI